MSRVYCPQRPARWNQEAHLWVPTLNIHPAAKWGELVVMFDQSISRSEVLPIEAMRNIMRDFSAEDYLVAVGDPGLLAAASCIAVQRTGGSLRLLRWDRQARDYLLVEVRP